MNSVASGPYGPNGNNGVYGTGTLKVEILSPAGRVLWLRTLQLPPGSPARDVVLDCAPEELRETKQLNWVVEPSSHLQIGALGLVLLESGQVPGQQVLQHGFEARDPIWVPGPSDAAFKETAHTLTDETAHSGQRSEHIQLQVEQGSYIHYTYDIGRAPVNEELSVSLWVKANRPGIQLLCRVVLPQERDPRNADQPLTAKCASIPPGPQP